MLQKEASEAIRQSTQSSQPDIGRIYYGDVESGVMEEAERTISVLRDAQMGNALQVLAELNKKKELKNVDHSSVEYMQVRKNLYTVPRDLTWLTDDDVEARRAKLGVRVRGRNAPARRRSSRVTKTFHPVDLYFCWGFVISGND
mmetsp:Transcript_29862/g.35518  ORF Transcript_29862/g.35518 Transcript_29862/m.35518 type:complete len:144 (+) Transcript_29862:1094-1525(+)